MYEIEDISELTLENFYDPSMNASFANYKDNCILCRGNKIGFPVRIADEDGNARVFSIFRDSFGKALEDLEVIFQALLAIGDASNPFYIIRFSNVVKQFYKVFKYVMTDELYDEIQDRKRHEGVLRCRYDQARRGLVQGARDRCCRQEKEEACSEEREDRGVNTLLFSKPFYLTLLYTVPYGRVA